MAYLKLENPDAQRLLEEVVESDPGGNVRVVRRWRLFGEKALHGDLESLKELLRENEQSLLKRRGRIAIFPENPEEKAEVEASQEENFAGIWERVDPGV